MKFNSFFPFILKDDSDEIKNETSCKNGECSKVYFKTYHVMKYHFNFQAEECSLISVSLPEYLL
jgi:hypothetical protein